MTIRLEEMEPEARETIKTMVEAAFLDGDCYILAIALFRGTGWPMIGLMVGDIVRHAAVRNPDGIYKMFWDARGAVGEEQFGEPFGISPPYILKPVTEKEFTVIKPVSEFAINLALKMSRAVWPDLPWKPDTLKVKVISFAEELEELSRKHGLWIYGCIPAALPVIAEGQGDETGYELKLTMEGLSYMINRVIGK